MNTLTMKECMKKGEFKSIESVARYFEPHKQTGHIFYQEDLYELGLYDSFELYYAFTKGTIPYRNAVPIPKPAFFILNMNDYSYKWFRIFYQLYYKESPPPLWEWKNWGLHVGEQFVWVYRKGRKE